MNLRQARPGDEEAVARVHVRTWQEGYRGLLPDDYLQTLDPADRAARYTFGQANDDGHLYTEVAVDGEAICGFATTGGCRDTDQPAVGELYAIYVDPDWWSRGVGRALIEAARHRLSDQGYRRAVLWVLVGNTRAERFYRIDGWGPDGERRREELHGIEVDEVRYGRSLV